MDLTKLGSNSWSDSGKQQDNSAAATKSVANFIQDINLHATSSSLNDLLNASKANGRFADNSTLQKSNKPILLSSTAPLIFPSLLKKNSSNFDGISASPMDSNLSKTIHFGET